MDKIVIIEDDPGIQTVLRLALKGAGFTDVVAEERGDSGLRAEADRTTEFTDCNVADIVQTAVSLQRPLAEKAGIQLSFPESDNHTIEQSNNSLVRPCDSRLVESAVSNLIQNALRHSGSKAVEVKVEGTPDGKAVISVCDHGIGIPADSLPRLFERFYRVDKNRSRTLGGTGLGLAIVKHIAQLHGGEVAVKSTPGKGSEFRLVI